jgi:hypothetical protein
MNRACLAWLGRVDAYHGSNHKSRFIQ